jgi:hypothetical protein
MIDRQELRSWLFRGLMFEADAQRLRDAGIRIGADEKSIEEALLQEVLTPFSVQARNEALRMARLYSLLYCFENSVRALITKRLEEKVGSDWWQKAIPRKIVEFAEARQKDALENSWLEGARKDPISFIQFGHLADIMVARWEDFEDLLPSQHWVKQRLDEIEKVRNWLAHNRLLNPSEFQRIEIYIDDWDKAVGL